MPAWLVEQTRYDFSTAVKPVETAPAVDEFSVVCEFHTFVDGAIFSQPFLREQILLRQAAARLDGQPATAAWRPDGTALEIAVPAPGKHRLELSLGAVARRQGNAISLELALLRAAESRVVVPPGGAEISSGPPRLVIEGQSPPRTALPPSDALSIRWPAPDESPRINAGMLADQFLWWKLRPGSAVLEAKFRLQPVGGQLQQVAIAVDPRLRLLPATLAAGRITVEEGPQHLVKVEFLEPQEGPVNLRLSWLWTDVTGLGELRFPAVQVQADPLARQWQALSVSGGLELAKLPRLPPVSTAEFMQAWGESAAAPPTAAFDMREAPRDEPVLIQPANRLPRAEQSLDWSLRSVSATAHINVLLSQVPESRFDYRLALPPQLAATSVRLVQGGRPAAVRWLQQPDGLLWLTLLEPPAADQELSVVADLPLPRMRTRLPLAAPRLHDAVGESSILRIFRQPEIGVQLESPAGWTLADDFEAGVYQPGRGRLVATLRNEGAIGDTQPIVSRTTNRPEVKGFAFIRAHEADGDWRGEVDLALEVKGGVLDDLRLTIPDSWAGSFEFEPPLAHRIEDLPGPRKRLTIIPAQAISGAFSASIRGALHSGDAGLAAPDVALMHLPDIARIVLLDRGQGGNRIDWETTGLMSANPSDLPLPDRWKGAGGDLLRVVGPRFDATARSRQETTAAPRVRLADVHLTIAPGGRVSGVGRYTIRPAGARGINVVLPSDCRLVQALIDGVATTATSQGPRNWELPTPSSLFPFELTVVFDGALVGSSPGSDLLRLAAPRLPGMLVEHTTWEIATPGRMPRFLSGEAALRPCTADEAAVLQLEAAASSLEDVAAVQGADVLAPVLAETAAHWNGVYLGAKSRIPSTPPSQHAQRVEAAAALAARTRERLAELDMNMAARDDFEADGPAVSNAASALFLEASGEAGQVTLSAAPTAGGANFMARFCAALFVGLAAISVPLSHWPPAQQWLSAHAHLVLALAGLLWWLFAPLGWLGWIAVLAAVRLSVRFP